MAAISLDPDQADQTASAFSSCRGSIEGELNSMMNSANAVMSTWQGNSRNQFEEQWEECQNQLRRIMEQIEDFSQRLRREAEEFRQAASQF